MTGGDTNPKRPSTCLYLVLESRGAWWVDREGKSLGPYETRDEAESGAFHLIEVFGDPARPIEVWSRDDTGKMRLLWKGGTGPSGQLHRSLESNDPKPVRPPSDEADHRPAEDPQ